MYNTEKSTQLKEKFKELATEKSTAELANTYAKSISAFFNLLLAVSFRSLIFYIAQGILAPRLNYQPFNYLEVAGVYGAYEVAIYTLKENVKGWKKKV